MGPKKNKIINAQDDNKNLDELSYKSTDSTSGNEEAGEVHDKLIGDDRDLKETLNEAEPGDDKNNFVEK